MNLCSYIMRKGINHLITCKELAEQIKQQVKEEISKLREQPTLAIISNNKPDGERYIRNKVKVAEEVGIKAEVFKVDEDNPIHKLIDKLSQYSGLIIQMPFYDNKKQDEALIHRIPFYQDVDGLTCDNGIIPATALGIYEYLKANDLIDGKNITIIGRSKLVGMPLAKLLLNTNATVTLCHSKTKDLQAHTLDADVIVCAVGKADFVNEHLLWIGKDYHIVDVGINFKDGKMVGDVSQKVKEIPNVVVTPVPSGVGLLTTACLMRNTLELHKLIYGYIQVED